MIIFEAISKILYRKETFVTCIFQNRMVANNDIISLWSFGTSSDFLSVRVDFFCKIQFGNIYDSDV
ncbi:Phosphogluconate dehydrogenase (Decarboxylating), NAD binding domain protein [Leptospira santarosai]|uniref:Phosphogluconate dehydrogenase (Decarboxylating), NAD binding domain protein n=1 Tax=Leptospira santarosai TaxID=28183 RepID=A0A2P1QRC3_9LEPT|nr:Phosphogluconate dehydrogenase (Decarboxylating), NAD binding domain protein [Leptospira santarosai]